MSKGAATVAELARAVETLKRRDRETRGRVSKLEQADKAPRHVIHHLPAAVTPPPAATPVRTTLGATLSQAWALLKARHSLTRALSFFTRWPRRSETGSRDAVSRDESLHERFAREWNRVFR